jgi:DedD protein
VDEDARAKKLMAGGSKGGNVVLGGRHLVGLFALLVVVLGIVFTLGYLLGRSRYEDQARTASASPAAEPAPVPPTPPAPAPGAATTNSAGQSSGNTGQPPANWDFFRSGDPAKTAELTPAAPAPSAPPKPSAQPATPVAAAPKAPPPATKPGPPIARSSASAGSALIPKGAVTLQVAALLREGDALALAQALQEKKFPTIVTTPSADKYYRVQVGPYPDVKSATSARRELEKQGFKSIVRK